MHNSTLTQSVARAVAEDRIRDARDRGVASRHRAQPPGTIRRTAATAAARVARRLDADAARRTMTV